MNANVATECGGADRVLLVDDDVEILEDVTILLRHRGLNVREATDRPAALSLIAMYGSPYLVVTDLQMPGMDGAELVGALNREVATADVPIIVFTGCPVQVPGATTVLSKTDHLVRVAIARLQGGIDAIDGRLSRGVPRRTSPFCRCIGNSSPSRSSIPCTSNGSSSRRRTTCWRRRSPTVDARSSWSTTA